MCVCVSEDVCVCVRPDAIGIATKCKLKNKPIRYTHTQKQTNKLYSHMKCMCTCMNGKRMHKMKRLACTHMLAAKTRAGVPAHEHRQWTHAYTHTHTYTRIHQRLACGLDVHTCMHARTHARTHPCMHARTHTDTHRHSVHYRQI